MSTFTMTETQTRSQSALARAVDAALKSGQSVPCCEEPKRWDNEDDLAAKRECLSCPVIHVCRSYALTGSVQHGIMAGLDMCEVVAKQRRAQRAVKIAARAAARAAA